jgi:hypothetical protein
MPGTGLDFQRARSRAARGRFIRGDGRGTPKTRFASAPYVGCWATRATDALVDELSVREVSPLLATLTTVALIVWTIRYGKVAEQQGARLRAHSELRAGTLGAP